MALIVNNSCPKLDPVTPSLIVITVLFPLSVTESPRLSRSVSTISYEMAEQAMAGGNITRENTTAPSGDQVIPHLYYLLPISLSTSPLQPQTSPALSASADSSPQSAASWPTLASCPAPSSQTAPPRRTPRCPRAPVQPVPAHLPAR